MRRERTTYFKGYDAQRRERRAAYDRAKRNDRRELIRLQDMVTNANKMAVRYGLPGRISVTDVRHLPEECVFCGATAGLSLEHLVPLSRGGENHWSNLTTSCRSCNSSKRARTGDEFRASRAAA